MFTKGQTQTDERAEKLVALLGGDKTNCGFVVVDGLVVVRRLGFPYTHTATVYEEEDLRKAVQKGLLAKRKVVCATGAGIAEWEWYALA